ncbi:MAG: alpha/beta hydrolase [Acidobacteria bacterium]|nr:alpha/beta hydrolase [Acidobacteriota bacterium]
MRLQRRSFIKQTAAGALAAPLLANTSLLASVPAAKFINVDGINTRYYEVGSGPDMVLVHGGQFGGSGSADNWLPILPFLSAHFHVCALDKLGMGMTDNPKRDEDYSMVAVIRHVHRFIETLGLKSIHLVGGSRGALPSTRIAMDFPQLVRNLIFFDSNTLAPDDPNTPIPPDPSGESATPTKDSVRASMMSSTTWVSKRHVTDEFVEAQWKIAVLPKIQEAERKLFELRDRFARENPERVKANPALAKIMAPTPWWMYEVKYETLDMMKSGRLKTPTLVLWGYNDRSAPFNLGLDLFKIITASVSRARLHVFNQCGHQAYVEYPAEVTELILDFTKGTAAEA